MSRNVEILAKVHDLKNVRRLNHRIAGEARDIFKQEDTFLHCPNTRLKLRRLSSTTGQLNYYKRPNHPGPHESRYQIHETVSRDHLLEILASAFGISGLVRKRRSVYIFCYFDLLVGLRYYIPNCFAGETVMLDKSSIQEKHIEWLRYSAAQARPLFEERRQHGWVIARRAAKWLREKYGVTRVRVFGSLLYPSHFHARSDIDLAVEGLDIESYWAAVTELYFFDDEISIELLEPDSCSDAVWGVVEREGVDV